MQRDWPYCQMPACYNVGNYLLLYYVNSIIIVHVKQITTEIRLLPEFWKNMLKLCGCKTH